MGKAEENKKKKREALLSQAYLLFVNKGISNTSIADIAHNAKVGKGTFYFYFKDKEDLIEHLIAERTAQLFSHAIDALNKQKAGRLSVEDTIIFVVDDLLAQLSKDAGLVKFINKNLNYGIYKKALTRKDFRTAFDFLENYFKLIESDDHQWKEPTLMLYTIVELVSSTCHSVILEQEPMDLESYKPYLFACIRNVIAVFRQ